MEIPAIPYDFANWIGKDISKVKEILGDKPYLETKTKVVYKNSAPQTDMITLTLNSEGTVTAISVKFNAKADINAITESLNKDYVPDFGNTTETTKAYLNANSPESATLGITWDINKLMLAYKSLDM